MLRCKKERSRDVCQFWKWKLSLSVFLLLHRHLRFVWICNRARRGCPVGQRAALFTRPVLCAAAKRLDSRLDLCAQVRAVEGGLVYDGPALGLGAVPTHAIRGRGGPPLLQHNSHGVGKAHRIVGCIGRQQEHVALADDDVAEAAVGVNNLEHHGTLVLVEPFGRLVDVVVGAGVGATDDLQWPCGHQYS